MCYIIVFTSLSRLMQTKRIIFSWVILMRGDKLLLLKRKSDWDMNWRRWVPWWHINKWENSTTSAIRELEEEVGISIKKEELITPVLLRNYSQKQNSQFIWQYFVCKSRHWDPINNEPHKCSKIAWFNLWQLPKEVLPSLEIVQEILQEWKNYYETNRLTNNSMNILDQE